MPIYASERPDRVPRLFLVVRLRTFFAVVAATGVGMGWWEYRLRRAAVDGLLAAVRTGITLEVGVSSRERDPTYPPDRFRYENELQRVRARHGEALAEIKLSEALRVARLLGDEKSMRGALVSLLWIGQGSPTSATQIIRTANGCDLRSARDQGVQQIRCLAIHVLGRAARQDASALDALIDIVERPDESWRQTVSASAANELGGLGANAKRAVPALIKGLSSRHEQDPNGLLRVSSIDALMRIGPEALASVPGLIVIAEDRSESDNIRLRALHALSSITKDLKRMDVEPTESHERIVMALARLMRNENASVREEAGRGLRGVRQTLLLCARNESRLEWILRVEENILGTAHSEVAATVRQLKALYSIRGQKEKAAKLESRWK